MLTSRTAPILTLCLCAAGCLTAIRAASAQEDPRRDDRAQGSPDVRGPQDPGKPDLPPKPNRAGPGMGKYPHGSPDGVRHSPPHGGAGRPGWPGPVVPGQELPQSPGPMPPGIGPPGFGPGAPAFGLGDLRHLEELKRLDPEMYELEKADRDLERQTMDLAQQYRRAPRPERESLKAKLKELIEKHFEVRQSRRELHLKRLQEELEKVKQAIERRNEVRKEIVERRVRELTGEGDDLEF